MARAIRSMTLVLQALIDAVSLGSIYALTALGIGLIFGILRLINFAHGDFITIGAYSLILPSAAVVATPFLGVRANFVIALAFAISGLLAAVVSLILVTQSGVLSVQMGLGVVMMAFVATVIGGMGSLVGAAVGGFVVGVGSGILQAALPDD